MLRIPGGHGARAARRSGPDPRRLRLLALTGVVVAAVALPLAVASAGPAGNAGRPLNGKAARNAVRHSERAASSGDAKLPAGDRTAPLVLGLGLATATRCGPQLTSPDGVEAQTCVLTQGDDTWGRTYYRNTSGKALDTVLSLMEPGGHTLQTRCAAGADDEPATCETPREHTRGALDGYTAVSEFASHGADGPLLLRSGSNSGSGGGN